MVFRETREDPLLGAVVQRPRVLHIRRGHLETLGNQGHNCVRVAHVRHVKAEREEPREGGGPVSQPRVVAGGTTASCVHDLFGLVRIESNF